MFDTLVVRGGSQSHHHSHNTRVTEKKAPTDESMRLLDEFKAKAEESIISRGILKCANTDVEIAYMEQMEHFGNNLLYRIKVNGRELEGKLELDKFSDNDILSTLRDAVAGKIASAMMLEILKSEEYRKHGKLLKGR